MKSKLISFSRLFVGFLFIFSGLIKANDPLGFGYKLQEYFEVFHLTFFNDFSTLIAILLCSLEIVFGVLLLLGLWAKKVSTGLLFLILFFTFLTFVSAFFKVVTSCGCFGDAIPLTPWQSFSKDIVLLFFILIIFVYHEDIKPIFQSVTMQKTALYVSIIISLGFGFYTYSFLPIFDFLPYKVGANIPELMKLPTGAKPDIYSIIYHLKNKKTNEEKEMTDKEYLKTEIWKDVNWEIVGEPISKLVQKGDEIKIKDLLITDATGINFTQELIDNPYYNLVIVAYNLKATNEKAIANLNALAINAIDSHHTRTVLLTASSPEEATKFAKKMKFAPEIFYADAVPLKSMVRANPGLILLKNGIVIQKWHYNSLPTYEQLVEKYLSK
ncbi:MAG: DoxX family membrane protein [Sphingobacteriaceae bacterium]|nr:DoxX family membrane protein [Sphingobacteriaceae bacterium]